MHSLQQRKAAAMKQQPMMGAFGAPPHGAHPTLLAQYQEYASRLNHHISQMQREGGGAGASAMGHMGGASAMGYPPQMQHAGGQQQQQQQQMAAAQGAAGGDTAQWEAAVKQQQEQHFQHLYMQWHFEQQMHQMGQWQQYQQQMAAAQGAPEGPLQYSGSQAGSSSPTGAPPRAL